jgi:hypothetical protein
MKRHHKKGQLEVLFLIVIAFAFALTVYIGYKFINDLNTNLQSDGDMTAEAKAASLAVTSRYPSIFDAGVIMFFSLVWIAILVSAWFIDTSPIFFIVSLIVFVFTILVSFALSDVYSEFLLDADFVGFNTAFPMINFILGNLGLFCLVVGFSLMVVLYGKSRAQNA